MRDNGVTCPTAVYPKVRFPPEADIRRMLAAFFAIDWPDSALTRESQPIPSRYDSDAFLGPVLVDIDF